MFLKEKVLKVEGTRKGVILRVEIILVMAAASCI